MKKCAGIRPVPMICHPCVERWMKNSVNSVKLPDQMIKYWEYAK